MENVCRGTYSDCLSSSDWSWMGQVTLEQACTYIIYSNISCSTLSTDWLMLLDTLKDYNNNESKVPLQYVVICSHLMSLIINSKKKRVIYMIYEWSCSILAIVGVVFGRFVGFSPQKKSGEVYCCIGFYTFAIISLQGRGQNIQKFTNKWNWLPSNWRPAERIYVNKSD